MQYASFRTVEEAVAHRTQHGGHIYVPHSGAEVLWFSLAFTPTPILLHPLVRAVGDGILNPKKLM